VTSPSRWGRPPDRFAARPGRPPSADARPSRRRRDVARDAFCVVAAGLAISGTTACGVPLPWLGFGARKGDDGIVRVAHVFRDSPASRAGLGEGDEIFFADGVQAAYDARGLTVLGFTPDAVPAARASLASFGIRFGVASDEGGALVHGYGVTAWPTLFLADKQGKIRHVYIGYDKARDREIEAVIRALLTEP